MAQSESPSLEHELHPWTQRILDHAATIGAAAKNTDALRSYSSILLAMMKAGDPVSWWAQHHPTEKSFNYGALLERLGIDEPVFDTLSPDDETRKPSNKLQWTQSARQLLSDADEFAGEGTTIRPMELMAALIYGDSGKTHERDLMQFGLIDENPESRLDWANSFVGMAVGQDSQHMEKWLDIHQRRSGTYAHSIPQSIDRTPIPHLSLGASRLYLGVSRQPWRFDAQALVIPFGDSAQTLDESEPLIAWLQAELGSKLFNKLLKQTADANSLNRTEGLIGLPTNDQLVAIRPEMLIFVSGITRSSSETQIQEASKAILEFARTSGIQSVIIPLPGSSSRYQAPEKLLTALAMALEPKGSTEPAIDITATVDPEYWKELRTLNPSDTSIGEQLKLLKSVVKSKGRDYLQDWPEASAVIWAGICNAFGGSDTETGRDLRRKLDELTGDIGEKLREHLKVTDIELASSDQFNEAVFGAAWFTSAMRAAHRMAQYTGSPQEIRLYQLAIALLLLEPGPLTAVGVDIEKSLWILIATALQGVNEAERSRWNELFPALATVGDDSAAETRRGYANDGVESARYAEADKLDINRQARLFAQLVVNEEVEPPLSIGLFGNWGTGKSFFMTRLSSEIKQLEGRPGNVSRTVQVTFNAWHFVDANLWASLATKIFDEVANEIKSDLNIGTEEPTADAARARLTKEIESSQRHHQEARHERDTAQQVRSEALKEYQDKRGARLKEAMRVGRERLKRLDQLAEGDAELKKALASAKQSAERMGIDQVLSTANGFHDLLSEVERSSHSAQGLWKSLLADLRSPTRLILPLAVPVVVVIALIFGGYYCLETATQSKLSAEMLTLKDWLSDSRNTLMQWFSILGAAMTWMTTRLKSLSKAVDDIKQIIDKTSGDPIEASQGKHLRELDEAVHTAETKIREADRQIAENEQELERIDAGGLVYDFLENKVNHDAYLKYRGLISIVRDDFESLEKALKKLSGKRPVERIVLYIDDLDRCRPQRVVEVLEAVHLLLSFRLFVVVVAVDSRWLRTSLERAYRSLTGIADNKLSLAYGEQPFTAQNYLEKIFQIPFSLARMEKDGFAGLVDSVLEPPDRDADATDSTSIESITQAGQSGDTGETESAENSTTDSTQDRRPSSVEPKQYLSPTPVSTATSSQEKGLFASIVENIRGFFFEAKTDPWTATPGDQVSQSIADTTVSDRPLDDSEIADKSEFPPWIEADEQAAEQAEVDQARAVNIAIVRLSDHERVFIHELHPFIKTPRQTKRFVNIYRLIRPRPDTPKLAQFAGEATSPNYMAALIMLAANVGYPTTGGRLLRLLLRVPIKNAIAAGDVEDSGDEGEVETTAQKPLKTWSEFLEATSPQRNPGKGNNGDASAGRADPWSDLKDWERQHAIELYQLLAGLDGDVVVRDSKTEQDYHYTIPGDLRIYRELAVQIGRYSFDWNVTLRSN